MRAVVGSTPIRSRCFPFVDSSEIQEIRFRRTDQRQSVRELAFLHLVMVEWTNAYG